MKPTEQVQLGPRFVAEAVRCLGLQERGSSEEATAVLGKGAVVFGVVRGKDARIMVAKVVCFGLPRGINALTIDAIVCRTERWEARIV